jgi:hypothetical protein
LRELCEFDQQRAIELVEQPELPSGAVTRSLSPICSGLIVARRPRFQPGATDGVRARAVGFKDFPA